MATTTDKKNLPPLCGTILKIAVTAELGNNLHLSDVDFTCTFYSDSAIIKRQIVKKDEMVHVDNDTYMSIVDTKIVGTGNYYCRLDVDVPDNDVEGGLRKEVVSIPTYISVKS